MKIDLHCHTLKVKQGDPPTRNVTKEKFYEKVIKADVKLIAITNHNKFDFSQYTELKQTVEDCCEIWPGVELDIRGSNNKKGHLIIIANPKNVSEFNKKLQQLVGNTNPDNFCVDVKTVYESLDSCDCIYIPHFHKEPKLSEQDIKELSDLLSDSTRLFKETSDYRSLGVYSNFDYSVIIGSDVQDWDKYEDSSFADIRLPIETFEQFCLLAKKDNQIIDTLLNKKRKREICVSPHESVKITVPIYEDINIFFGQKGTGKSEILKSLRLYYMEKGVSVEYYEGNQKENDFSKLLKTNDIVGTTQKLGINNMQDQFEKICNWTEEHPVNINKYIDWLNTKDNNKNKAKMKITESVHMEEEQKDNELESDYNYMKEFTKSSFDKINLEKYLSDEDKNILKHLLNELCKNITNDYIDKWKIIESVKFTNWSIDKIKDNADKCSETKSKPSTTGFYEFALKRFELFESVSEISDLFSVDDKIDKNYLGNLEEKGNVYIKTRYRMLCQESRREEFRSQKITSLRDNKKVLDNIKNNIWDINISEKIIEFQNYYNEGIRDLDSYVGVSKEISLESGEKYNPSNGEKGILLLQKLLDSESDVYILDELELGMGNSYITSNIIPKLVDLAKMQKTVIIATHNANIAVGTLPYVSVFRSHKNGIYKTYVGNPFNDELKNIEDGKDIKNWTKESMHTLEGGKAAFYGRKDIYESGRKNN